jgi:hypothetical protein
MSNGLINATEAWDKSQNDKSSLYVSVTNSDTNPIPVIFTLGQAVSVFDESLSVAAGSNVDVVSYTVPVGKTFALAHVEGSGCSVSEYTVLADTASIGKRRTAHGAYDFTSPFGGVEFAAGTVIKVNANNTSGKVNDFAAKIVGSIKDV